MDIQLEIKLHSSAVTHLSLGSHNSWKGFDTDRLKWCRQAVENNSSEKAQPVYVGIYFSWNSLLETNKPLTLKPA